MEKFCRVDEFHSETIKITGIKIFWWQHNKHSLQETSHLQHVVLWFISMDVFNEYCLAHVCILFIFVPILTHAQFPFPIIVILILVIISCYALAICPVRMISLLYLAPADQVSYTLRTQLSNSLVSSPSLTLFN